LSAGKAHRQAEHKAADSRQVDPDLSAEMGMPSQPEILVNQQVSNLLHIPQG
jgi:hypothetical protein